MQKDFITATPDTGGGNGAINVTASKNTSSERNTSLTISGAGGVTKTVNINQKKGIPIAVIVGQRGNILKMQL